MKKTTTPDEVLHTADELRWDVTQSFHDSLMEALRAAGIGCGIHYATPIHLQPAYEALGHARGDFPVAEEVTSRCVSLPVFPDLQEAQVDRVAAVIRSHLKSGS